VSNDWSQNVMRSRRYNQITQARRKALSNSLLLTLMGDHQRSGLSEVALEHCLQMLAAGEDAGDLAAAQRAEAVMVRAWCEKNGYTDLFYQEGTYWAFSPRAVLPVKVRDAMTNQM
jgi:hypothetical protein